MTVFILIDVSGYVYAVFDTEDKAYDYGAKHYAGRAWDVVEREVQ